MGGRRETPREADRQIIDGPGATAYPTLHGLGAPDGLEAYVDAEAGFSVRLLSESHTPYRACVRADLLGAAPER